MKLLLDTSVFLWLALDIGRVPNTILESFKNPQNNVFLSPISLWEITLKYKLGRLHLNDTPQKVVPTLCSNHDIVWLDFTHEDAFEQIALPLIHRDPFDRMLICQAKRHGLTLVTPDALLSRYPIETLW